MCPSLLNNYLFVTGAHHHFLLASSPCIVGSLWPLIDLNTDIFFTDVMTMCFVPESMFDWMSEFKQIWNQAQYNFIIERTLPLIKQKSLLEAIAYAKVRQKSSLTSVPFVTRGLPIEFSIKEN